MGTFVVSTGGGTGVVGTGVGAYIYVVGVSRGGTTRDASTHVDAEARLGVVPRGTSFAVAPRPILTISAVSPPDDTQKSKKTPTSKEDNTKLDSWRAKANSAL